MSHYFFHIRDDHGDCLDDEGMELADDMAAKREGEISAREMFWHDQRHRIAVGSDRIEVATGDGDIRLVEAPPSAFRKRTVRSVDTDKPWTARREKLGR